MPIQWIQNYENGLGRCKKFSFFQKIQLHFKLFIFTQSRQKEWRKWHTLLRQGVISIAYFNILVILIIHTATHIQGIRESEKCMSIFPFSQINYTTQLHYRYK